MVSDNESQALARPDGAASRQPMPIFYQRRRRIYTGLLLFVVVVGLPIVGVPYLRNRLSARILALKAAAAGGIKPAFARVGANPAFPAEYERPEPPVPQQPQLPPMERIFTATAPGGHVQPRMETRPAPGIKVTRIAAAPPPPVESEEPAEKTEPSASQDTGPKYQQGKEEKDAYDLLLKSNPTIAGMVQGSNPSLRFKSWDAAHRGEDIYWVRLTFQSQGNPDVEYIWQVKLRANQVAPLSYNARTIN